MAQVKGATIHENEISKDVKKAVLEVATDMVDNYEIYTQSEVLEVKTMLANMIKLNEKLEYHDEQVDKPKVVESKQKERRKFWQCIKDFIS